MQINTDKRFPFDGLVLGTFERSIYHSSSIGDYPVYEIRGDELGEKSSEIFSIPRSLLRGDSFTAACKIDNSTPFGYFMGEV